MSTTKQQRAIELIRIQLIDASSRIARIMALCPRPEEEQILTREHVTVLTRECENIEILMKNIESLATSTVEEE